MGWGHLESTDDNVMILNRGNVIIFDEGLRFIGNAWHRK